MVWCFDCLFGQNKQKQPSLGEVFSVIMIRPVAAVVSLLLFLYPAPSRAALPPGYEDRTFCPPGYCLGRRHPKPGSVGPKSLFWECRWGDGSPKDRAAFRPAQTAGSTAGGLDIDADEQQPVRQILPWGPRLNDADNKLKALLSNGYHERLCPHLHAPLTEASGGIHTVYVPNDQDEGETGVLHRMGLDPGAGADAASTSGVLAAAGGILCFVLFCCVSSAMSAASSVSPPPRGGGGNLQQHHRDNYGRRHTSVNFETDKYR